MEESYKKRSIIIVFSVLLIFFVFLYKGIILSGDEYYKEYIKYSSNEAIKSTSLKNAKTGTVVENKKEKKNAFNATQVLKVIENLYIIINQLLITFNY